MTGEQHFRQPSLEQDFELLGEIGRGGMGIVYRARDRRSGRDVAVKVIRSRYLEDAETVARFEREAKTAARLAHPGIVAVHELRRLEDGGIALIMQYVPGGTLKEIIADRGMLSYDTIEEVLRDVAGALSHAHARGIIHRDVKPENIYLDQESHRALLADFGIARNTEQESSLTLTGVAIGTPAYMSPEQIDGGELDGRSDLYSLGLVGWEMLSARRPWEGESLYGVIYRQKHENLATPESLRPDVPPRIAHAITWALMKEPRHRPPSIPAFLEQLERDERMFTPLPSRRAVTPPAPDTDPSSTMKFDRPAARPTPVGLGSAAAGAARRRTLDELAVPAPEEQAPWWRRRAAAVAALIALPALLVVGALATGAMTGTDDAGEPTMAIVDQPVTVPIGPPAATDTPGLTEDTAEVPLGEDAAIIEDEPMAQEPAERPVLAPTIPISPAPDPRDQPLVLPAPVEPRRDPPTVRAETVVPAPAPAAAPAAPAGRADEMTVVAAGGTHTCAISGTGELYCWGGNDRGQLAADGPRRSAPAGSASDQRFTAVAAGLGHTCALNRSGEAYCWGGNANGQLGSGSVSSTPAPTRVAGGRPYRAISAGVSHTCAIARTGEAYCWGGNSSGQVGDGTTASRTVPVRLAGGGQFIDIAAGRTHSCAVSSQQVVYCWGANTNGQLGDGSSEGRAYPGPVSGSTRFVSVVTGNAHSCAISTTGEVYCWGDNGGGQLGDGSTTARHTPTRVAGEHRFTALVAGSMHTCGVTRAGEAYCWGRNTYGQLGDGSTGDRASPVRVRGGHTFRSLNASGAHTCGVAAGEALCWGYNVEGQLGDGSRSHRATPVAVGRPSG